MLDLSTDAACCKTQKGEQQSTQSDSKALMVTVKEIEKECLRPDRVTMCACFAYVFVYVLCVHVRALYASLCTCFVCVCACG